MPGSISDSTIDEAVGGALALKSETLIIPTITTSSRAVFDKEFEVYCNRPVIHLDYSDGTLAPSRTLALSELNDVAGKVATKDDDVSSAKPALHIHIMADDPRGAVGDAITLHPRVVFLHAESKLTVEEFNAVIDELTAAYCSVGIALLQNTRPDDDKVKAILSNPRVHEALIFGGKLGYQGGTADLRQLDKIPIIRQYRPDILFSWDGGANVKNVDKIRDAGVNTINVGAAVAKARDPLIELALLDEIVTEDSHEIPLCNNCD